MELIKDLGTRTTVTSTGKKDTRKWGIFKCPVCSKETELKQVKGFANNTCGSKGCRSKGTDKYGSWNKGMPQAETAKNIKYYSSIGDYYRRLKSSNTLCDEWNTLSGFMADMYDDYLKLRSSSTNHVTLHTVGTDSLSKVNCTWKEDLLALIDFDNDKLNGVYHTRMLAHELNIKPYLVTKALARVSETFGEYAYGDVNLTPTKTTKAYILSKYQYDRLHDIMLANRKKVSDSIYLIKSGGFTKIGITSDFSKRLNSLVGSNPLSIEVVVTKQVVNAREVEVQLHTKYAEFNTHHEWFNLTEDQVQDIVTYLDSVK